MEKNRQRVRYKTSSTPEQTSCNQTKAETQTTETRFVQFSQYDSDNPDNEYQCYHIKAATLYKSLPKE